MAEIVHIDQIVNKIFRLRGAKVILDRDIASLYGVETKVLKRNVRRHIKRFPADFMFELSHQEFTDLRRQIDTSSWGGTRYMPMVFTEQGVAMLSGILNSDRAIEVNIQIMRAFVQLRQMVATMKNSSVNWKLCETRPRSGLKWFLPSWTNWSPMKMGPPARSVL